MKKFVYAIKQMLMERIGKDYSIQESNVLKVNNDYNPTLVVRKRNEEIGKCIYMEQYFQRFCCGETMDKISDDIVELVTDKRGIEEMKRTVAVDVIRNYEVMKNRIGLKLINAEMNGRYLNDKIYVPYLNLAVVCTIFWTEAGTTTASASVTRTLFNYWNVSEEELFMQAYKNMQSLFPATIRDMNEVILRLVQEEQVDYNIDGLDTGNKADTFYVLTTQDGTNGAVTMLYQDIIKEFAEEQNLEEVIIIPSSVHEVLLVPKIKGSVTEKECLKMLRDVNCTEVKLSEVLSDDIYIYSKSDNEIQVWKDK